MKLSSHPRGSREDRSKERRGSTSPAGATNRPTVRTSLAPFVSSTNTTTSLKNASRAGSSATTAFERRVNEGRRERGRRKKKAGAEKKDKTRSKKSRKKKHRKRKHRVSSPSSSSSSSPSSRSASRSPSRTCFRPSSWTDQSKHRSPPGSSSSVCEEGGVHNQKVSGWDVGPEIFDGRRLPVGSQPSTTHDGDSNPPKEKSGLHEESVNTQQHDPRTYEKAFGVAIPRGQYAFVSEETNLAVFLPGAERGQLHASIADDRDHSSSANTEPASAGGCTSIPSGRLCAVPPALGVLRLLKEANESENRGEARFCENSAEGWKKNSARGTTKVTSKTHPHLFWQCWNCSADNYKTRHQCYRCNRLYMQ